MATSNEKPVEDQSWGPAPVKEMPAGLIQPEIPASTASSTIIGIQETAPAINHIPNPEKVTPLHLLGSEEQSIDCPFCQRRTQTRVSKVATSMQTVVGAVLCLFCICLTCVPCLAGWFENMEYRCSNCSRMVALRPHDGPMQTFGPQSTGAQEPSQYPPAEPRTWDR